MITNVRIELPNTNGRAEDDDSNQVLAYAVVTMTLEDRYSFVINDIKIIQKGNTRFVAMPSRLRMERCPVCHTKVPMNAAYCGRCGHRVEEAFAKIEVPKRSLHSDVAHPIDKASRDYLHRLVFAKYDEVVAQRRKRHK